MSACVCACRPTLRMRNYLLFASPGSLAGLGGRSGGGEVAGLKNKGTVDTQPRRFQLSRTPNNTFPLTISGRASQVGIASLSGSLRQWIKEQRQKNIPLSLSLHLSLFLADYCWLAFLALLLINANSFLCISLFYLPAPLNLFRIPSAHHCQVGYKVSWQVVATVVVAASAGLQQKRKCKRLIDWTFV